MILVVFLLRSFLYEPFKIPSGSMMPTLLTGDLILVNKFTYGLRLPVINTKITEGTPLARGDVVVFRYPPKPSMNAGSNSALRNQLRALLNYHCGVSTLRTRQMMRDLQAL